MKEIVPDYRLDMVGEPCPYPAVATLEALPQLQKGNSGSGERLPAVHQQHSSGCQNHGYTVLDIQQDGPTIRYLIQK